MAWVDFKKVYDMVQQNWKIHCLKIYKISDEIIQFIKKTMEIGRVELTAGRKSLAEANIHGCIFEKDVLSP